MDFLRGWRLIAVIALGIAIVAEAVTPSPEQQEKACQKMGIDLYLWTKSDDDMLRHLDEIKETAARYKRLCKDGKRIEKPNGKQ